MNEKISKIKLELLKEEFNKQIKDSYILNLSMVLLEEFEKLQQENKQLKENYERTYNENRALREKEYITDTDLIYENYILSQVIEKAIKYLETHKRKDEFLELNEWGTRDLLKILKEVR